MDSESKYRPRFPAGNTENGAETLTREHRNERRKTGLSVHKVPGSQDVMALSSSSAGRMTELHREWGDVLRRVELLLPEM